MMIRLKHIALLALIALGPNALGCEACNDRDELLQSYDGFVSSVNTPKGPSAEESIVPAPQEPVVNVPRLEASEASLGGGAEISKDLFATPPKPKPLIRSFSDMGK